MVSKQKKARMSQFILGRLEDSLRYTVKEADASHLLVVERPELVEQPATIEVMLHTGSQTVREAQEEQRKNMAMGTYTAHVFFKDSHPAHSPYLVRLARRGNIKEDRSLKRYTKTHIDSMVHLRAMEKHILAQFARFPHLVYYQHPTVRIPESLRTFDFQPVYLDYSHIGPDDPGYKRVSNGTSIDYKMVSEADRIVGDPARIKLGNPVHRRAIIERHTIF